MNKLCIAGIVRSAPIYKQLHGEPQLWINIEIIRQDLDGKSEKLTLMTRDEELMRRVFATGLQKGDLFLTDSAFIESVNYTEDDAWICGKCGEQHTNPHKAEIANAIFTDFMYAKNFTNESSTIGINDLNISGRIVSDPRVVDTVSKPSKDFYRCKCKIACKYYDVMEKRYKICYPFIVLFGAPALYFTKYAKAGDHINISGSLQERNYLKTLDETECPTCKRIVKPSIWQTTREIIVKTFDLSKPEAMIRDTSELSKEVSEDKKEEKPSENI